MTIALSGIGAVTEEAQESCGFWGKLFNPMCALDTIDTSLANVYTYSVQTPDIQRGASAAVAATSPPTSVLEQMAGSTSAQAANLWDPQTAAAQAYTDYVEGLRKNVEQQPQPMDLEKWLLKNAVWVGVGAGALALVLLLSRR